jgi:HipA-like protein
VEVIERLLGVRYVVPLREGGSLPAVVDTNDGAFVVKFRGAGQGARALVAEVLAAGLAENVGLPVPRPAIITLEEGFGQAEPDPEIQDILRGSVGDNFGLAYLAGAVAFDPVADIDLAREVASDLVWFDAFITNVDRTPRNTNLLTWQSGLWLIDHGASLYFHHRWDGWQDKTDSPFPQIKDHVLLPLAVDLAAADERLRPRLTDQVINEVVAGVPEAWLGDEPLFASADAHRAAYSTYLSARLNGPRRWLQEAIDAQRRGPERLARRLTHRVV